MRETMQDAAQTVYLINRQGMIFPPHTLLLDNANDREHSLGSFLDLLQHDHRPLFIKMVGEVLGSNGKGSAEMILELEGCSTPVPARVIAVDETISGADGRVLVVLQEKQRTNGAQASRSPPQSVELERRLRDSNQKLQDYLRYIEAGGILNIRLTHLTNMATVLQTLAEQVMKALKPRFTAVYQVEEEWLTYRGGVRAPRLYHCIKCLEEDGILSHVLRTNGIRFFPFLGEEEIKGLWRRMPEETEICSLLVVPILSADDFRAVLYLGFDQPTRFDDKDELVLRASVEATIETLHRIQVVEQLRRNVQTREQEVSVLYDLSTYAIEQLDLRDLLEKSLRRVLKAAGCDTGLIFQAGNGKGMEEVVSCWPSTGIPEDVRFYLRQEDTPRVPETGEPYTLAPLLPKEEHACITVTLNSKRRPGTYLSLFGSPQVLQQKEIRHLILIAVRQIGLSVDSILDRKLAEEAIVLEERQRMARNLHDSVTQSLYALTLSSDVAVKTLRRGEDGHLENTLEEITATSLQALKEMRLMLYELRPSALEKTGLIEALNFRLNTVERRSGMDVTLECQGELRVPEAMETELYSIISEALNNSLRHSGAQAVSVTVRAAANLVTVEVEDNGKGFDVSLAEAGRSGMGLHSMQERTRKLGGNLVVESVEEKGTRISVKVRVQGEY